MKGCLTVGVLLILSSWCGAEVPSAILLRNGTLDTRVQTAARSANGQTASAYVDEESIAALQPAGLDGRIPVLAQFNRPISAADRQALAEVGAVVVNYIPDQALLLMIRPASLTVLQDLNGVHWIGGYPAEMKIDPALPRPSLSGVRQDNALNETIVVVISVTRPHYVQAIIDEVDALGGEVLASGSGTRWGTVRVRLPVSLLETLSARSEVEWIELYRQPELNNNVAVGTGLMNVQEVWTNYGLTGAGQIVALGDSGLDTGDRATIHPDFSNRIHAAFGLVATNDWSDHNGHGTHTTGSVLGNGAAYSNGLFRGVAYEAEVVFQAMGATNGSSSVYVPTPLTRLFSQAYSNDARIHSDSWGSDADGAYDSNARSVDEFMWDCDDMLIVFSAGNAGRDANQDGVIDRGAMGSPGTAKNCLTVGAAESLRPAGSGGYSSNIWATGSWMTKYPTNPIRDDLVSTPWDGTNRGMAAFSSRGPCQDQRIKPDVIAPGTDIISCRSHVSGAGTLWGTGSGVLDNSASNDYCFAGGTSMATPLTAGSAALVRQYLAECRGMTNPSAALMKAMLVNGARSLAPGQYGTGAFLEIPPRPSVVEGWGHVDLAQTLYPDEERVNMLVDRHVLGTGQTNRYQVVLTNPAALTVTLAWSDYPGALESARQLVNDLDVCLIDPDGDVVYPNGLSGGDHTNNLEGIDVVEGKIGTNWIEVSGYNVPQEDQPYALIIKGTGYQVPLLGVYGFWTVPSMPYEEDAVSVYANVSSNTSGLAAVVAAWQVNSNGWNYLPMAYVRPVDESTALYQTDLPEFTAGDQVDFCMYAMAFDRTFVFSETNHVQVASRYLMVAPGGSSQWPYSTWRNAFTNIQQALDYAQDGFTVTVTNGTYRESTLIVEKPLTLRSLNGAASTIIDGQYARICLGLVADGAEVNGFTLYRGYAANGAGVYMTAGTLSSSIVYSCMATQYGGGIYLVGGTVSDTLIRQCASGKYGGGLVTLGGVLQNSRVIDNTSVSDGGGMEFWGGTISNCTVAFNQAGGAGGGIDVGDRGYIYNTICVSNSAAVSIGNNWYKWVTNGYFSYCCLSPNPNDPGCIDVDPLFVNPVTRDLHLKSALGHYVAGGGWSNDAVTSPCIDMGHPASDYFLEPSPNGTRINMGAYAGTPQASKGDTNTYKLLIYSYMGGVDPAPGVYTNSRGAEVSCVMTNPMVTCTTTQYLGDGWALTALSDVEGETSGTGMLVSLMLTNSGVLTWNWHTNFYGVVYAHDHGVISGTTGGWFSLNGIMRVRANADTYYGFTGWTGTLTATENPFDVTMTKAHELWASFAALRTTNGVPQWWLAQYGWTNDFETAAAADPDLDGASTEQEYVAGTIPTNTLSVLELFTSGGGDAPVILSWRACADRTYTIQWSTNLLENITNRLFSFYTAIPMNMVIEDDIHTNACSLYYRIKARYEE